MQRVNRRAETKWYLCKLIFVRLKTRHTSTLLPSSELTKLAVEKPGEVRTSSRNTLCVERRLTISILDCITFLTIRYFFIYLHVRIIYGYIKIVRRARNSPQRCGRRVANPISIKTDGSILFKREWFVCNLQWHNTVSAESRYATLCICAARTYNWGI